jgi:hypothetical protein
MAWQVVPVVVLVLVALAAAVVAVVGAFVGAWWLVHWVVVVLWQAFCRQTQQPDMAKKKQKIHVDVRREYGDGGGEDGRDGHKENRTNDNGNEMCESGCASYFAYSYRGLGEDLIGRVHRCTNHTRLHGLLGAGSLRSREVRYEWLHECVRE